MLLAFTALLFCKPIQKYPYAVFYGSTKAKHKLVNYFDIGCTHCAEFYRHTFPVIKKNFCDKGKLLFIYTPYPIHKETLIYMSCSTRLNSEQKQALFETLMEIEIPVTTDVIRECMKVLKTPYLDPTSRVLQDALSLTQQKNFDALPVMFFDGKRLRDDEQDNLVPFLTRVLL